MVYMLKKQLSEHYSVLGIELDKNDFLYFNDEDLKSISSKDLQSVISNPVQNYNVILVDVNDTLDESMITEMIYLIEPSTLMINKMVRKDRNILEKIKGRKVVLNKSLLNSKDLSEFEYEAGIKVFYNMPPLNERKQNNEVVELLRWLGLVSEKPAEKKESKVFGLFRR